MGLAWEVFKHEVLPKRVVPKRRARVLHGPWNYMLTHPRWIEKGMSIRHLQRRFLSSRAKALLSMPFLIHRGRLLPVPKVESPPGLPLEGKPYFAPGRAPGVEIPLGQRKRAPIGVQHGRVSSPSVSIQANPIQRLRPGTRPLVEDLWRASVCVQRSERREVLFARSKAGRGVRNRKSKRYSEVSKVRC